MDSLISEISVIGIVLRTEDFDSLFKEFFEKFYFITNYPNEENLGRLIDDEWNDLFNLIQSNFLGAALDRKMLEFLKYFKKKKAEFTTHEDIKDFFDDLKGQVKGLMTTGLHVLHVEGLREYGIRFKNNPEQLQSFIQQTNNNQSSEQIEKRIFHFCTITPRLSAIKVLQTIETFRQYKPSNSYIFTNLRTFLLEPKEIILRAFQMEKSHSLLVIECHGEENEDRSDLKELKEELFQILLKNSSKKLILIAKSNSNFGSLKAGSREEDEISFRDLEETSQTKVLKKKSKFPRDRRGIKQSD